MKDILQKLEGVEQGVTLAPFTTFKIGGEAKYFYRAKSTEDFLKALCVVKDLNIPFFLLSGGSNLLISDEGFDGLVIKVENRNWKVNGEIVISDSGMILSALARLVTEQSLTGLEFGVGIPGTVGGAVRGNAGAFGTEIKDILDKVYVWNSDTGEDRWLENQDAQFGYRESIFKKDRNQSTGHNNLIILQAIFNLQPGDKEQSLAKLEKFRSQKDATQPFDSPSAGCSFKNVELKPDTTELKNPANGHPTKKLLELLPEEFIEKGIIPAGWLVDKLDLKGKTIGGAQVSKQHGNFIINLGDAKAEHVVMLIAYIKQKVRSTLGIQLEEEIQYIGF